jgi:hypothetical protein
MRGKSTHDLSLMHKAGCKRFCSVCNSRLKYQAKCDCAKLDNWDVWCKQHLSLFMSHQRKLEKIRQDKWLAWCVRKANINCAQKRTQKPQAVKKHVSNWEEWERSQCIKRKPESAWDKRLRNWVTALNRRDARTSERY